MQQEMHLKKMYTVNLNLSSELKNFINKDNKYKIPIFIPHKGCKNECVFCNQRKISGELKNVSLNEVRSLIDKYLEYFKDSERKIEIAFFGGSFTGISIQEQIGYLRLANEYINQGEADGIRISTRPDYINPRILKMLKKYNVSTIELGVQSMKDSILEISKRGHTRKDVIRASRLIRLYGINLGHQIMVGLPNSSIEDEIYTINEVLRLKPHDLRIYPVYVINPSELFDMYNRGEYIPLTIKEAINRVYEIVKICSKTDVNIIRLLTIVR